jgi:hypothetical protein
MRTSGFSGQYWVNHSRPVPKGAIIQHFFLKRSASYAQKLVECRSEEMAAIERELHMSRMRLRIEIEIRNDCAERQW